ncbi:hypothetical protein AGOR_G00248550 [Albula goreensis]|uniref:Uncharacterized protein n=1 Tax=Albula goreensis TaxID=1534307 RepID=A0A8T3CEF2_9TELE|nr:hypothetical protein AGOR_G00248550 [Albula goreensis]
MAGLAGERNMTDGQDSILEPLSFPERPGHGGSPERHVSVPVFCAQRRPLCPKRRPSSATSSCSTNWSSLMSNSSQIFQGVQSSSGVAVCIGRNPTPA